MFNHGIATAKNDIGEIIKKDESGVITAYLPEMEKFAVIFTDKKVYLNKKNIINNLFN
jgi:hypothetical protein